MSTFSAQATSIVVKVERNRFFIAADTLQGEILPGGEQRAFSTCKVRSSGQTVYAIAGILAHYHAASIADAPKLDWDAYSDAQSAFKSEGDDPQKVAKRWGDISINHIAAYAQEDPAAAIKELTHSQDGFLYAGIFFRWTFGSPTVVYEFFTIDNQGVRAHTANGMPDGIEWSPNIVTAELIAGKTQRAKESAHRWALRSKHYSADELAWRHMQFLIQETSKFDHTVSPKVDIAELLSSGKVIWLSRSACR